LRHGLKGKDDGIEVADAKWLGRLLACADPIVRCQDR